MGVNSFWQVDCTKNLIILLHKCCANKFRVLNSINVCFSEFGSSAN